MLFTALVTASLVACAPSLPPRQFSWPHLSCIFGIVLYLGFLVVVFLCNHGADDERKRRDDCQNERSF